jgi:integration host factor subunit beta
VTKSELIKKVADWSFEITHTQAEQLVSIILKEIIHAVQEGKRVEIRGFGVFLPRQREARIGHNPKTGETVSVPAKNVMFFKAGKELKDRLNGKKTERKWINAC